MAQPKPRDPHNVEAEQAFLGSIIQEPKTISRAARLVRPADGFVERHSVIFQAMLDLEAAGQPIDLITLSDQLASHLSEVGGFIYLQELAHAPWFTAQEVGTYAAIVRKHARLRRLIAGAGRIARLAHRASRLPWTPDEALALAESTLLALVKEERLGSVRRLADLIQSYLERLRSQPETGLGLSTGLAALDDLCGRLQPADLVLVAGGPGTLKTALTLKIARSAATNGHKVALFSLESSNEQVVQRLLVTETGLSPQQLRVGAVSDLSELIAAGERLEALDLYIDDTPGLLLSELRSKARWLDYLWSLDLVIVNYLQLLRPDQRYAERKQELSAISRALKALARELKVPLVAVSSLDPALAGESELVQFGPVQYEADIIWLCEKVEGDLPTGGLRLWLKQARWRNGPAGAIIELRYDPGQHDFIEAIHPPGGTQRAESGEAL
jgi:replicative DNA helicase